MSCFVMNRESLSTLAAFIADMLNFPHEFQLSLPDGIYQFADCGYEDDLNLFNEEKIYEKLYRLNLAAYHERYGREPNGSPRCSKCRATIPSTLPDSCPNCGRELNYSVFMIKSKLTEIKRKQD